MALQEIMQQIESFEFAARINVASTRKVFFSSLTKDHAFLSLTEIIRNMKEGSNLVLKRIKTLCDLQIDYRYEHPYDVALSAYALAIAIEVPKLANIAAELLLNARQTWWSREIASIVLENAPASLVDKQTDNVHINDLFGHMPTYNIETSGNVLESEIYPSLISEMLNFELQGTSHKIVAILDSQVKDFLWSDHFILLKSSKNIEYKIQAPQRLEKLVNWSQ